MPRKTKTQPDQAAADSGATSPEPSAMPTEAVRKVAKKAGGRKTAAKKQTTTRPKQKPAEPSAESTERRQPTDDEIRLRAYFIAERRVQMGIPGGETDDWIEARRQLEAELGW